MWKIVAKSADVMENADKKTSKMGIVVDGRGRLSSGDDDKTALMATYFGNVLSIPFGEKIIGELKDQPLSWVADEVHEYLKAAVTKEHFLGLIDWVEAHRPEQRYTAAAAAMDRRLWCLRDRGFRRWISGGGGRRWGRTIFHGVGMPDT